MGSLSTGPGAGSLSQVQPSACCVVSEHRLMGRWWSSWIRGQAARGQAPALGPAVCEQWDVPCQSPGLQSAAQGSEPRLPLRAVATVTSSNLCEVLARSALSEDLLLLQLFLLHTVVQSSRSRGGGEGHVSNTVWLDQYYESGVGETWRSRGGQQTLPGATGKASWGG